MSEPEKLSLLVRLYIDNRFTKYWIGRWNKVQAVPSVVLGNEIKWIIKYNIGRWNYMKFQVLHGPLKPYASLSTV